MSGSKQLCLFVFVIALAFFFSPLFICHSNASPAPALVISGPSNMNAGGTAAFTASGGCGQPYTWSIYSGGGQLSSTIGSSVNYTLPSGNSSCESNIISVTDAAGQISYKQIAITNTYSNFNDVAFKMYTSSLRQGCSWGAMGCYCYLNVYLSTWNCAGNVLENNSQIGGNFWVDCLFNGRQGTDAQCWARGYAIGYSGYKFDQLYDIRTAGMKSQGCCPANISTPQPPPSVTVPYCSSCDLQINTFDVSNTIVDQNGSVSFTGNISSSKPFSWKVKIGSTIIGSGTSAAVKARWNLKNENFKLGESKKYTATLTVTSNDNTSCTDSEDQIFTVKYRKKDCKLEIKANSSINVATGNLSHSQNLFTVPNSGLMSDFTLYYNSTDGYSGILGSGWTHTYNIFLSTDPTDDAYILSDGQGSVISLYRHGDYYTSDISAYPMLQTNADGTYALIYKNGTAYTFNANGKITAIADKNDNTIHLTYNALGNLINITDATGKTIYFNYDGSNRISAINDPNNNSYAFTYSGSTLTQVSSNNSLGTQAWKYTYDDKAFMLTKTDPQSNLVQYTYDNEYRLSQTIDPQGGTINVQYDPDSNTTTVTEKDGGIWIYKYDPDLGALKSKTDPSGGTTSYEYDSNRNLTSTIAPDGTATTYTYDQSGNMTSVTDALGNTTTYTYNDQNLVISITDSAGRQTQYTYDAKGNILSTTDPAGAVTQFTYDSKGNITSITAPNGGTTTMTYDANNNLISVTDPGGQTTTQTYDNADNMTSQTDAAGNKTTFQYNSLNQLVAITDSAGKTTQYIYDANGNRIASTDANGNTTTYDYNYKNQLIQTTDAAGFKTAFTYGTGGCSSCGGGSDKLTSVIDAKNQTTTYQYDQTGRLIKETDPLGNSTAYTYDAKGNMISKTKPDGRTITYIYDDLNRLVERKYPNNTSDAFQYDTSGNMTGATNQNSAYYYSYDANNRITGVAITNLSSIYNIEYQYDIMGNKTAMTTPDGKTIKYSYNQNNQLTKIETDKGNYTFAYDSLNRRIKRTLPSDSYTTYSYDQLSRLTNITHKNAFNITIDAFSYTHDNAGNRITKKDTIKTISYNYDQLYRLTKATPKSNNPLIGLLDDILKLNTEAYSYDAVGNRNSGPKSTDSYTYNSGNEQLSYKGKILLLDTNDQNEYDLNGNLTKKTETTQGILPVTTVTSYTYDDENRLIDIKIQQGNKIKEVSFTYDPFGRRINKTVSPSGGGSGEETTNYVYDEQNIIAEYDQNNKQIASYIHGPNIDEPLSAEIRNNRIYYHADGLGSITALTNHMGMTVQRYDYDAFGNIKFTPFPIWIKQPYMFTGREYDHETGLYYYRARYYDAKIGRFITRDPIGFDGGDVNLYNYVGANPVNRIDPSGLFANHFYLSMQALEKSQCPKLYIMASDAAQAVDARSDTNTLANVSWHAMRNGLNGENAAMAASNTNNYINKQLNDCSAVGLGNALHAEQDKYAGGHMGYQPWYGNSMPSFSHWWADTFHSNTQGAIIAGANLIKIFKELCPCACQN